MIDNKPMFWNRGRKRWLLDRDADQANLAGDGDGDPKPPPKPKPKWHQTRAIKLS
jgi:hypothetical protein